MQVSPVKSCNLEYNNFSFGARNPLGVPLLKSLKNVTCVYCGQEMLTLHQIEDFSRKAAKLSGKRLAKFLSAYETRMKPNEISAVILIKEALKKYPHSNLKQVLEKMFPHHIKKLETQQKVVLGKIAELTSGFSEHDRAVTLAEIKRGYQGIERNSGDAHFKRNQYISKLYFLKNVFENPKDHDLIMSTIASMPNTHTSIDAFIVKYSRKSPYEIAYRLLSPNRSTIEHLKPRSTGGTNELTNLVLACGKDNSTRSSKPLDDMPSLERYLPDYFRTLRKSLAKKLPVQEFKAVSEYINGVKKNIDSMLKNGLHICDNSKSR